MTTITAQTILRSRHAQYPEKVLSTLLLRYPRCIHAELMTHRQFSRNAASSRAIPVEKLIKEFAENLETFPRWQRQVRTPRKAGIIYACSENRQLETCANHIVRPVRSAEEYGLPLTIWDRNPNTDANLAECLRLDYSDDAVPDASGERLN